jgi:hypothetical protein
MIDAGKTLLVLVSRSAYLTVSACAQWQPACAAPTLIRECEEHGWMRDRSDPHARERAVEAARHDPPPGASPDAAVAEVREVLDSIGDLCLECPTLGA